MPKRKDSSKDSAFQRLKAVADRLTFRPHRIRDLVDHEGRHREKLTPEFPFLIRLFHQIVETHASSLTWHERLELMIPLDGRCRERMGDEIIDLERGDPLVVDNMQLDQVVGFPGFDTRVIIQTFTQEFVCRLQSMPSDQVMISCHLSDASRVEHDRLPETLILIEGSEGSIELGPDYPSVFDHFHTQEEFDDFFGGVHARQAIVCVIACGPGPEGTYALGEQAARGIYAPVTRAHRITEEQMAILEPIMAEVCAIALIKTIREMMEGAIERGVPRAAAEDFMYGHIKVPLGIAFERAPFPFSDGANLIADYGRRQIINENWRALFEPENVEQQVQAIVSGKPPEEL